MEEERSSNSLNEVKYSKTSGLNTESDPILFFHLFKQNLLWFAIIIFLCVSLAFTYLRYTAPVYSAKLVYQVNSVNTANKVLDVTEFQETNSLAKDVEILKSKLLFKRALHQIPIDVSFFNEGEILTNELYRSSPIKVKFSIKDSSILGIPFYIRFTNDSKFSLKLNEKYLGEFDLDEVIELEKVDLNISFTGKENSAMLQDGNMYFRINDFEQLTNNLNSKLSVYPLNNAAKTINISFEDKNPEKAKDIVTAIANEYITYDIEERRKSSKKALYFIDEQLTKYYNKVKNTESKIEEFQTDNNYSMRGRSSIYFERSSKLENDLISIDLQQKVLLSIKESISSEDNIDNVYDLLPMLVGTEGYEGLTSIIEVLKKILLKKENLKFAVTLESEAVKSLNHKINVEKRLLFQSVDASIKNLSVKKDGLFSKITEIKAEFKNVPAEEMKYARLQRVLMLDEKFYNLLMEKRTEYSISDAGFVTQHLILDRARLPIVPVFPNKNIFIIFGFVVGFVLSLVLILIKYILKDTISSIDEVIRYAHSDLAVLGVIPKYKYDIPVSQLVVNKNPKSIIAESFRVIRSNMQFISNSAEKKILAVTSTVSGEGKTFVAINTAGILAYSGKKVVILDLDMRKPKIHVGFGVENSVGMSSLLIKTKTIAECIYHSELENLDFITSGPIPPNPSELIINGELDNVIKALHETYDFIIIDNPPIGLVSDAMSILKKADYPIYVFKSEYSKKYFVNNLDRLMLDNKIKNLSVVLNALEHGKGAYGGSYGYGGGYGYGGYYEDEPKESKSLFKNIFGRKK